MFIEPGPSRRGWHRIAKARNCLAAYGWSKMDGENGADRPAAKSDALVAGSAWHLIMAHRYAHMGIAHNGSRGVRIGDKVYTDPRDIASLDEVFEYLEASCEPVMWSELRQAYRKYEAYWANEAQKIKVMGVETELETRLPDFEGMPPLPEDRRLYTQRADLVIQSGNRVYIVDHKSVFRIASDTLDQFLMDGQFLGYAALGDARWGTDFGGVTVNRTVIRGKSAGECDRQILRTSPAATALHFRGVYFTELQILQQEEMNGKQYNLWHKTATEQACYGKYGACPHLGRCRHGV
jgi:hypothetical protein